MENIGGDELEEVITRFTNIYAADFFCFEFMRWVL